MNNVDGVIKFFEEGENRCVYYFLLDGYLEGYNLNVDEFGFIFWILEMGNMMFVVFVFRF